MKKIAFASLLFAPSLLLALSSHTILKAAEDVVVTQGVTTNEFEWLLPIEQEQIEQEQIEQEQQSESTKTDWPESSDTHISTPAAANTVTTTQISSYNELASTMRQGRQIAIILDLAECTSTPGMPTGFFSPSTMMLIPAREGTQEHFATSHLQFTDHNGAPTYEYIKYTFNADGTVVVNVTFYDPKTFKSSGLPHTINCTLGKGVTLLLTK